MFHRAISLPLIALLLIKGMGFAHCHAGTGIPEAPEHDLTPHFHVRCLFGTSAHQDCCPHDRASREEEAAAYRVPTEDHDDDAIYVPASVVLALPDQQLQAGAQDCPVLVPLDAMVGVPFLSTPSPLRTHPPPLLLGQACPIYLRLAALLL
jgi:hypothetical protein